MTRDRLAELRAKQGRIGDGGDSGEPRHMEGNGATYSATDSAVVINMDHSQQYTHGMERFFQQVEELRRLTHDLKDDVRSVKTHHSEILSKPIPDDKQKQELDALMSTIKTSSMVIRAKLKDMEKGIKEEEEKTADEQSPASLRIRRTQHSALLRDFVDIMNEYQKAQVDYRDRCKARIKRQLNITEASFTDEEVESMIEEGNFSVFTEGILGKTEEARQMLADVEARHNDILKLEKSLKELHDLFLEMAMLVESQGEVVDRIETQVMNTRDYTEKAREQLRQAEELQTKARKKKIYIIIIVILIVLVLGIIIYTSL